MRNYIGAIIAAHQSSKQERKKKRNIFQHPINTVSKEQYYIWQAEGKCGGCGANSGEYKGICDQCRHT